MLSVKVKLKFGESNLLDNRGIEAVKTAVKPYTLKEKKRRAWDQATSFSGSQSRLRGEVAPNPGCWERWLPRKKRCGVRGEGEEERPLEHRPALW